MKLAGWKKRIRLDIDYTNKIGGSVTQFPVTIFLKPTNGDTWKVFNEVGNNYRKIAITKADGVTELKVEMELWDVANKVGILHTSLANWVIEGDTSIYLYYDGSHYDNPNVGNIASTAGQAVWDSNFKMVQHMKDLTTSTIEDSTSNNNDGTKKGCLPKGTIIRTTNGVKDIIKIEIGDEVLSYSENGIVANKVLRVINSGVKTLYELKTSNRTIRASSNHPFLKVCFKNKERKSGYNTKNNHPFSYLKNDYELKWTPLAELEKGDTIITYIGGLNKPTTENVCSIDFMKLLGCYLGDGSNTTRKNRKRGGQIVLHLYNKELIDKYSDILNKEGISHTHNHKIITICKNAEYDKLCKLGLIGNAHNKIIPEWVYSQSDEHKKALIEGLIDSDGYVVKYGYGIGLCNKELIKEIRNLCIELGWRVSNINEKEGKSNYYKGRIIKGVKSWSFTFYPESVKDNSTKRINLNGQRKRLGINLPKGFQFQTITSIKELGKEETYDLEIENTHNFIANDVIVHNSNEPIQADGQIAKAQSFDGTDDYIREATFTGTPGSYLTICAWIKTSEDGWILQLNRNPENFYNELAFVVKSGKLEFWDYSTKYGFRQSSVNSVNTGTWKFVCFTKSQTTGKYYIDGQLDSQISAEVDVQYGSNDFVIGKDYRDDSNEFFGLIDEVRISNVARSAAWIKASYNSLNDTLIKYLKEETLFSRRGIFYVPINTSNFFHFFR